MTRDALARRIAELAVLHGDFTLRSGKKSKYYVDKYRFETQPDVLRALGEQFAAHLTADVDRIAGPELGAIALAASAALASGRPFLMVRKAKKDYGTTKQIEGVFESGDGILLVEDILTTGGAVLEAAQALTAAGAKIIKIVGVIDRQEGARENIEAAGFAVDALFTSADLGIIKNEGPH